MARQAPGTASSVNAMLPEPPDSYIREEYATRRHPAIIVLAMNMALGSNLKFPLMNSQNPMTRKTASIIMNAVLKMST